MTDDENRIRHIEDDVRNTSELQRELERRLDDALRRLDELERSRAEDVLIARGDTDDDGDIAPQMEAPDPVQATLEKSYLAPDENATDISGTKRKSISFMPETDGGIQLHEFDNAPPVGVIGIRMKGNKIVLTDPDGNTGSPKWLIPIRRFDTAKELKWALIGEGSDSDSDSDSDADAPIMPTPPPYLPGYYPPDDGSDSDGDHPYDPGDPIYIVIPNPDYPEHDNNPWIYYDISHFFWLRGGASVTNYGTSLKLGSANVGYITIRAV